MPLFFLANFLEILFLNDLSTLHCFDNASNIVELSESSLEVNGFHLTFDRHHANIVFNDFFSYNSNAILRILFAQYEREDQERIVLGYVVINMRGQILSWCSNFSFVDDQIPTTFRQHTGIVFFLDHHRLTLAQFHLFFNRRIVNMQRIIFSREHMFAASGFIHSFYSGVFQPHTRSSASVNSIIRQFHELFLLIRGIRPVRGKFQKIVEKFFEVY